MSEERLQEIKDSLMAQYMIANSDEKYQSVFTVLDEEQELVEEVERLHSIIKEVREYIKTTVEIIKEQPSKDFNDDLWILNRLNGFLEILDKENK